jgi:hypothetical protein
MSLPARTGLMAPAYRYSNEGRACVASWMNPLAGTTRSLYLGSEPDKLKYPYELNSVYLGACALSQRQIQKPPSEEYYPY